MPVDLELARRHLEEAFEAMVLDDINACAGEGYSASAVREALAEDAAAVLDAALAYAIDPYRHAIRRIERLRRLRELGAPQVIVEAEEQLLREAIDELI